MIKKKMCCLLCLMMLFVFMSDHLTHYAVKDAIA